MTGTVVEGRIVPDEGAQLREGAKYHLLPADENLPPDHPMAPFNLEREVAMIRESIESGERGVPHRQVFEELYREHGLGPLPPR
jgi:hypothetical protein